MAIVPIALPIVGGPGRPVGQAFWETNCVASIESDPGSDGFGGTAALFGYLSDIWIATCWPGQRTSGDAFEIVGSGFHLVPPGAFPLLKLALVDFEPPPPDYTDLLYGQVPIYYLGMMGFGYGQVDAVGFNIGPLQAEISQNVGDIRKAKVHFINHLNNIIVAEERAYNAFWWHLKEGVRGTVSLKVFDNGFGASANPGGAAQSWAPSYGGWCQVPPSPFGQVFDGCGNPACGNGSSGG